MTPTTPNFELLQREPDSKYAFFRIEPRKRVTDWCSMLAQATAQFHAAYLHEPFTDRTNERSPK